MEKKGRKEVERLINIWLLRKVIHVSWNGLHIQEYSIAVKKSSDTQEISRVIKRSSQNTSQVKIKAPYTKCSAKFPSPSLRQTNP